MSASQCGECGDVFDPAEGHRCPAMSDSQIQHELMNWWNRGEHTTQFCLELVDRLAPKQESSLSHPPTALLQALRQLVPHDDKVIASLAQRMLAELKENMYTVSGLPNAAEVEADVMAGEHLWVPGLRWEHCCVCGAVKRADGKNKPCKGPIKVELR